MLSEKRKVLIVLFPTKISKIAERFPLELKYAQHWGSVERVSAIANSWKLIMQNQSDIEFLKENWEYLTPDEREILSLFNLNCEVTENAKPSQEDNIHGQ